MIQTISLSPSRTWLLLVLLSCATSSYAQSGFFFGTDIRPSLRQMPLPGVPWGGVIHSIARNPDDPSEVYAGSSNGGLFKSTDLGNNWTHVDSFRPFNVKVVKFIPGVGVLVTVGDDWRYERTGFDGAGRWRVEESDTDAGIWRSVDGGSTWNQEQRVQPCDQTGDSRRPMAYGIAVDPQDNSFVVVATQCGIYQSTNSGDTFTLITSTTHEAVIVLRSGVTVAGGPSGIQNRPPALSFVPAESEVTPGSGPGGPSLAMGQIYGKFRGALADSPVNDTHVYAVVGTFRSSTPDSGYWLVVSTDNGRKWSRAKSFFASGGCGGAPFVRTARNIASSSDVDIFVGDACGFHRATLTNGDSTLLFGASLPWQSLAGRPSLPHEDLHDLEVIPGSPGLILLAGDGGLQVCQDSGTNIECPPEGIKGVQQGLNALEIASVSGQRLSLGRRHLRPGIEPELRREEHLYLATWHNKLWRSSDLGDAWVGEGWAGEGFGFELARTVRPGGTPVVAYAGCAACVNYVSGPLYEGFDPLRSPLEVSAGTSSVSQFTHIGPGSATYAQIVQPARGAPEFYLATAITTGRPPVATFTRFGALEDPGDGSGVGTELKSISPFRFAGFVGTGRTNPALYTIAERDTGAASLALISNFLGDSGLPLGSSDLRFPSMNLGTTKPAPRVVLGFDLPSSVLREIYAVDPQHAAHLIAPDLASQTIVESWDYGDHWSTIRGAAEQVTGGGGFRFLLDTGYPDADAGYDLWPVVSAISFYPANPELVLIGTMGGGMHLSRDRGQNWRKVPGSEALPAISGFHWRSANKVLVATSGRGLWEMTLNIVARPPSFALVCPDCRFTSMSRGGFALVASAAAQGDPLQSPDATLLVMDGRVESVQFTPNRSRVVVTPGSSWIWFSDQQTPPPAEVVEDQPPNGFAGASIAIQLEKQGQVIRGFTFRLGTPIQVIHGDSEVQTPEAPAIQLPPLPKSTTLGLQGKPYVTVNASESFGSSLAPGSLVNVTGQHFSPGGGPVAIEVDGQSLIKSVPLDQDGGFQFTFPANFHNGIHRVVVSQQAGQELISLVSGFAVVHADEAEGKKKGGQ